MKPLDIEGRAADGGSTPTEHAAWLKWAGLALLILQNSGIFLMCAARAPYTAALLHDCHRLAHRVLQGPRLRADPAGDPAA